MRDAAELKHYLTQMALDDYGMARLRPHIAKLAELLVEQMLHATRNGRALAQPNTAPLLAELASVIADTFSDEGVHECWECGTVGCLDEMHECPDGCHWVCDDCLPVDLDDSDHAYERARDLATAGVI